MQRTYECMLLLDNREVRQGWQPLKDAVTGVFRKHGAEVVSARRWDERRLAYSIRGQRRATYLLVYYRAESNANAAIRRDLEFTEAVLRHLAIVCDEIPPLAFEPETEFDVTTLAVDEPPAPPPPAPAPAPAEEATPAAAPEPVAEVRS